jgi:hypothetical protein
MKAGTPMTHKNLPRNEWLEAGLGTEGVNLVGTDRDSGSCEY